jgi:hypothetical protein
LCVLGRCFSSRFGRSNPTFSTGAVILAFCLIFSGKCESDQWAVVRKRV